MAFRWLKNYHVLSFRRGKEGEFQSERRHQSPPKISPLSSLPAQKFRIPRAIAVGVSARIENGGMGTKLCCGVARSRNSRSIYPEFMARLQSMPAYPDNRINCAREKKSDGRFFTLSIIVRNYRSNIFRWVESESKETSLVLSSNES